MSSFSDRALLTAVVGLVALLANVGVAFAVGVVGYHVLARVRS